MYKFIPLFSGIVNLILFLILMRRPKPRSRAYLAVTALSIFLWCIFDYILLELPSNAYNQARFVIMISPIVTSFSQLFFGLCCLSFARNVGEHEYPICASPFYFLLPLLIETPEAVHIGVGWLPMYHTEFFSIWVFSQIFVSFYAVSILIKSSTSLGKIKLRQNLLILIIGAIASLTISILLNAVVPILYGLVFLETKTVGAAVGSLIASYAFVKK